MDHHLIQTPNSNPTIKKWDWMALRAFNLGPDQVVINLKGSAYVKEIKTKQG